MKTDEIHHEIEAWMAGALCGGLSREEREIFERHLAECEQCRSLYREEQTMSTLLEKEMAGSRPEPEFGDAMLSRFRQRAGHRSRGWAWLGLLGRVALARPAQVIYAVLILGAMVKTGSVITGEGLPMPEIHAASRVHFPPAPDFAAAAGEPTKDNDRDAFSRPLGNIAEDSAAPLQRSVAAGNFAKATTANVGDMQTKAVPAMPFASAVSESDQPVDASMARTAPASPAQPAAATEPTPDDQRKLIRNATVQYEVAAFSKAVDTVTSLVAQDQGFVSTENSDRGANGKMEGTVEVKVLPGHLDAFLLKLRVLGDLKSQTLGTQDVTKDYFDTDARMRNAQQEEARLLDMLSKDTGRLSDLLQVERELARVRQSVEEMQGTLKYYNTMVQYATVSIGLSEKDMNAPAQFLLKERADLSIYATDVEATFARAREMAAAAKAQVLDSNVERDSNGQASATLSLLIDPAAADGALAQLKTLGRLQNFTSNTQRVAQDGTGPSDTARTDWDKVEAHLTLLQDQETAAQQTDVSVQAKDIESKMADLKKKAAELGATLKGASFERDPSGRETGTMELRMPLSAYPGTLAAVQGLGDVTNLSVHREEGANVTASAPAEMTVRISSEPRIVADDNGIWPTVRRTLSEGFAAVMWSVRMIGVSLAFFAPWLLALAAVVFGVRLARRVRRKSE